MKIVLKSIVLSGLLLVGSTAAAQGYASYSGEELFQRFCAACHGAQGRGDGPVASTLSVLVPDLTRLAQRRGDTFPAAEIREIIDGRSVVIDSPHGGDGRQMWLIDVGAIVAKPPK